jgi:poly-gamma-glutamate synthesis protein (capsule biosynthesis protein)
MELADQAAGASLRLEVVEPGAFQNPGIVPWVYALAAPFPTVTDDTNLEFVKAVWQAGPIKGMPFSTLLVSESTLAVFEKLWGPAARSVKTLLEGKILETAWSQAETWAIVPFEQLEPRWKVIAVDGQSPLRKDFTLYRYGLTVYFGSNGDAGLVSALQPGLPPGNRLPEHLTTVMLTGVTAMVRGTASLMEGQGMTYPAREIGGWLREADILHISNEVPFAKNCPQPFDWEGLAFCSQTEYIQLLEDVGTDVVELTGDHFADWGPGATLFTIEMYKDRGWPYYGGGTNLEDGKKPALFEHNGNKIAFLGCNAKEEGYASASATNPGAVHCDFDKLTRAIQQVAKDGYLPIVTFQHLEYYQYIALPYLQEDFRRVAEAGAVIVSGSQAHQPHAFEFDGGSMLHYGLGNLFFDQTNQGDPPRTAFIDRHVIYEGRHIGTELLTIYFVNYALSRSMRPDERQVLLQTVFKASGWDLAKGGN